LTVAKLRGIAAAATVLATLASAPAPAADVLPGPLPARVLRVVDGDTLEVEVQVWINQRLVTGVRIDGIDTPEKNGKCTRERDKAAEATAATAQLVAGPAVTLFEIQNDKYAERVRARVVNAQGVDVGRTLVDRGLARPYDGGTRQTWCTITVLPKP
jgi:endonuclease YncB( thermonuclease family)